MAAARETNTHWRQRIWLALGLGVLSAVLLLQRADDRRAVDVAESSRLAGQASTVEANLVQQLRATRAALLVQAADFKSRSLPLTGDEAALANQRLTELGAVMAGVSTFSWLDAQGRTVASNRPEGVGGDSSAAVDLPALQPQQPPDTMGVARPFRTAQGTYALNLSLAVVGADGTLRGHVVATLDPSYFETALSSVLYAPDMRAALAHGDGVAVVFMPGQGVVVGTDLARPGSMFMRHRQSGQAATVLEGVAVTTGERRLVAQRTVQPPELQMDRPLSLAISRGSAAVHANWQQRSVLLAALWLLMVVASVLTLLAVQRRQRERRVAEQARVQERAVAAERLELALAGAELALWDLDLLSGRCTVNPRWYAMLGEAPDEALTTRPAWSARLHPDDRDTAIALQEAHVQGHSPSFQAVYRLRHRLGHWVWVLDRARVVERDAGGRALRMVGTHMDISDRMQAEQTLRDSEQSLATTLHCIGDAVIATDPQGRITRLNAAAERMTGWTLDEARRLPLAQVFRIRASGTGAALVDPVAQVLAHGETVGLANDTVLVARDGREVQIADSAAPIRDSSGQITGVVLVFSDVTEHYRMVQVLRESEQTSRELLNALRSGVVVHAADTRIVSANPAACRILGLTLDQMQGRRAMDPAWHFIEEDGTAMELPRYPVNQVIASGTLLQNLVVGLLRSDLDQPTWALCSAFPVHGPAGELKQVVVTFSDFTERQHAEAALRASEARLRMVSRMARLGGWRVDLPSQQLTLAPEMAQALGLPAGPGLDLETALQRVAAGDQARLRHSIQACLQGAAPMDDEINFVDASGGLLRLRVLGEVVLDRAGQALALQGAVQDLSEQHRAQQQLQLLQASVERLNDVVLITEADPLTEPGPRIVFVNSAFERLTGWRRDEVLGRSPRLLQGPLTSTTELARVSQALARGEPVRAELVNYGKAGQSYWIEMDLVPLRGAEGRVHHFVAVQRDISDRKQAEDLRRNLEDQLREAQKMESIGTLAGGIAHDFNNILAAILGNVALAREDLPASHGAQTSLDQIQKAALRARSLVQQILAFSRSKPQLLEAQLLQPVVAETLALLRATVPASVRLNSQLPPETLHMRADTTQLQQVLLNLCTNAWHALPQGRGSIDVGLERLPAHTEGVPLLPMPATEGVVHLWVRDDGSGMDAATRQRIFDPFFTTKPVGQGTGLGLAVVHGIVRGHGGAISVDSEPGQGSTFHLYFPLEAIAAAAGSPVGAPAELADGNLGSGQHLLYVDDDEVLTVLVQRLLQRAGYRVTVCSSARQALLLVRDPHATFELVVSDFNMPEMSGLDLAEQLLAVRPGLPVVICSGYITQELSDRADRLGVRALMKKENTLEELAALVQRVLAGAA